MYRERDDGMDALRTLQVGDAPELNELITQVTGEATPVILETRDGTQAVLISAIMHEALLARLENVEHALSELQARMGHDASA